MSSYADKLASEMKKSAAGYISRGANTSVVNMMKESKKKAAQVKKDIEKKKSVVSSQERILKKELKRAKTFEQQISQLDSAKDSVKTSRLPGLQEKLQQARSNTATSFENLMQARAKSYDAQGEGETFLSYIEQLDGLQKADLKAKTLRAKKTKLIGRISRDPYLSQKDRDFLLERLSGSDAPYSAASSAKAGLAPYNFSVTEFATFQQFADETQRQIDQDTKEYVDIYTINNTTKEA